MCKNNVILELCLRIGRLGDVFLDIAADIGNSSQALVPSKFKL